MKTYFLATEYIRETLELISVCVVRLEDGNEFYGINSEFSMDDLGDFESRKIMRYIPSPWHPCDERLWYDQETMVHRVCDFVGPNPLAFWSYKGAYDWVVFQEFMQEPAEMAEWPDYFCEFFHKIRNFDGKLPDLKKWQTYIARSRARWMRNCWLHIEKHKNLDNPVMKPRLEKLIAGYDEKINVTFQDRPNLTPQWKDIIPEDK